MHLIIDLQEYDRLKDLSFAPGADVTGDTLPINEFVVNVITDAEIAAGQYAELRDELDNLWAKYWIISARRVTESAVRVVARSELALLDGVTLPATMYAGTTAAALLEDVMVRKAGAGIVAPIDYALDSTLENIAISGFCPKQSARERLQWVCMAIGAYVKTAFNAKTEILPIENDATPIPLNKTFWRPSVTEGELITEVRVTAYSFTAGTPSTTDQYVTDAGGTHYIVQGQTISLANPNATGAEPDNPVEIEGVYLINGDNASAILSRMAACYFRNRTVEADVIDNAEFVPGQRVAVAVRADAMEGGNIRSASFAFGKQARARLTLVAAEPMEAAKLTVEYLWDGNKVHEDEYLLPAGYDYTIENPYLDITLAAHRYIFRPDDATITGTMPALDGRVQQSVGAALDLHKGILHVISVDSITEETDKITIGVIA